MKLIFTVANEWMADPTSDQPYVYINFELSTITIVGLYIGSNRIGVALFGIHLDLWVK